MNNSVITSVITKLTHPNTLECHASHTVTTHIDTKSPSTVTPHPHPYSLLLDIASTNSRMRTIGTKRPSASRPSTDRRASKTRQNTSDAHITAHRGPKTSQSSARTRSQDTGYWRQPTPTQPLFAPVSGFVELPASTPPYSVEEEKSLSSSGHITSGGGGGPVVESWAVSMSYSKSTASPAGFVDRDKSLDSLSRGAVISIAFVIAGAVLLPVAVFVLRRRFFRGRQCVASASGTWRELKDAEDQSRGEPMKQ